MDLSTRCRRSAVAAEPGRSSGAGDVLAGRYVLHSHLDRDGDAVVFRGHDHVLDRPVGITQFPLDTGHHGRSRHLRTARVLAGVVHPALLTIYDVGWDDTRGFAVTHLPEGRSLAERLRIGGLSLPAALRLGAALAGGLAVLHRHGLVHGGLHPDEVLLDGLGRAHLGHLSVARATPVDDSAALAGEPVTDAGAGPDSYLAPEHVHRAIVGPDADVYSFGLILQSCLTDHRQDSGTGDATDLARLDGPRDAAADLPEPLTRLVAAMAAEQPAARPSAARVATELLHLAHAHP